METLTDDGGAAPMKLEFLSCPVQASLKVLGREWAFLVLTAIALFRANRFNDLIRAMPGLSKRLLTMRLRELESAGFIVRAESRLGYVRWELTPKGADVVPILLTMVQFSAKWYAEEIFEDGGARPLHDVFEERYIRKVLGVSLAEVSMSSPARRLALAPSSSIDTPRRPTPPRRS